MLTLQQLGNLVGMSARPVSLKAVAQMFGISVPFSYKQLAETAESGNVPRPFYIVGHNPNTIPDVIAALDAGANAIEPTSTSMRITRASSASVIAKESPVRRRSRSFFPLCMTLRSSALRSHL